MTFNLRTDFPLDLNNRWRFRASIVYEIFEKYESDIIGVQELNNLMYQDMAGYLKNYNIVGLPRSKKNSGERNDILVLKKHEILEHNTFWLSRTPEKSGSSLWYSMFPRICTTAAIKLHEGRIVRIYNTHLDCFTPKARRVGLRKIIEYMRVKYEEERVPIILMGDFNARPNSKLIREFSKELIGKQHFISVQEKNKELYSNSTMSKFRGAKKGPHIDYIFVSPDFEIINAEIIEYHIKGRYPSDHYPVKAEIFLR